MAATDNARGNAGENVGELARRERPLEGLRVLELGALIAGPYATRVMAEFGAEVIKVERPGAGDPLRTWRYVDPRNETSLWWALQSRNKKLVTLHLGHEEGLEHAKRLAAESDVLVENFKPGTLEKLGLGWEVLHEINPGSSWSASRATDKTDPTRTDQDSRTSARRWAASATSPANRAGPRCGPVSLRATRSRRSTPS